MVKAHLDERDVQRILGKLSALDKAVQRRVVARSLNRAAESGRTVGVREVRKELPSLRAKTIRERFQIKRASAASGAAEVTISRKAIPLIEFGASPKTVTNPRPRIGVSVRVKGAREKIRGSFIANVGAGHTGIFRRVGAKRLPIKQLFGPTVLDVLENHLDEVKERALDVLAKNLASQIALALSGGR